MSVALGIGVELLGRGHQVSVLGPESLRPSITDAGLGFKALGVSPPTDPVARSAYLVEIVGSTSLSAQLPTALAEIQPDVLVIDCNLSWALEARTFVPVAVLVHTALGLYLPVWQPVIDAANEHRHAVGLPPFSAADTAWGSRQALLVASLAHFDRAPMPLPSNATYVGMVSRPDRAFPKPQPARQTLNRPLVLVSYSTDPLQNSPARVQAALDGLADLPVDVLATTSRTFDAAYLSVPSNATVVDDVSHTDVMQSAAVVVAHAGHGTTLSALCYGVPLVCVPGIGRDQVPIAIRVAELGLGIALIERASPADIGKAVSTLLSDASIQERMAEFTSRCGDRAGAATAADVLESLVPV